MRYFFAITTEMNIFQTGLPIKLDDQIQIDGVNNFCWFVWELGEKIVWCFFKPVT